MNHSADFSSTKSKEESLPKSLESVIQFFGSLPDTRKRLSTLLEWGKNLSGLPAHEKHDGHQIVGCQAKVYLCCDVFENKLYFRGDADAVLVKGLLALLIEGINGLTPKELLALSPEILQKTGIKQSLIPSRANGFQNIFLRMQEEAKKYVDSSTA